MADLHADNIQQQKQKQPKHEQIMTNISNNNVSIRTNSNTIDIRGNNLEESKRACEDFFSKCLLSRRNVVFILHGHGTGGVLKSKIRDWLRKERHWVKRFESAHSSDGGDAFTKVELKSKVF